MSAIEKRGQSQKATCVRKEKKTDNHSVMTGKKVGEALLPDVSPKEDYRSALVTKVVRKEGKKAYRRIDSVQGGKQYY